MVKWSEELISSCPRPEIPPVYGSQVTAVQWLTGGLLAQFVPLETRFSHYSRDGVSICWLHMM